jgi:hypothetical protein
MYIKKSDRQVNSCRNIIFLVAIIITLFSYRPSLPENQKQFFYRLHCAATEERTLQKETHDFFRIRMSCYADGVNF